MQIHWTKINNIVDESEEIKTFYLDVPEGFTWEEGSYTHMGLKGFNDGEQADKSMVRHMSICTLPKEGAIGITTRIREQSSEYKALLKAHQIGQEIALFRTFCNVPLRRENKNVYLLSSGVGLATFRPLVLQYLEDKTDIPHLHSLNIDSSENYLYPNIFQTDEAKHFTTTFVADRPSYYEQVVHLANDKDGIFYVVGSDEFIVENIEQLIKQGIHPSQIMLDKGETSREAFFAAYKVQE